MKTASALLCALLLSGCFVNTFDVDPAPLSQEGSEFRDEATLYVLRDRSFTLSIYSIKVQVDDAARGSLRREQFVRMPLAPGSHTITANFPPRSGVAPAGVRGDFEPGHTYYFVFGAEGGFEGGGVSIRYGFRQMSRDDVKSFLAAYEDRSAAVE